MQMPGIRSATVEIVLEATMSDVGAPHHRIEISGDGAEVRIVIDGEPIPVRYANGYYVALRHSPYTAHASPQELANHVARAVLDMRRP